MNHENPNQTIFCTLAGSLPGLQRVRLFIASLREFGGALRDAPFWIFVVNSQKVPYQQMRDSGTQVIALEVPQDLQGYDFAEKVTACSHAEEMAVSKDVSTLAWIDNTCLVVNPPVLLDCSGELDAAVRPVHIRNVGNLAEEAPDAYWQKIYQTVGVSGTTMTVESFVDQCSLRPYFNSHAFSIKPQKNICKRWLDYFHTLVQDQSFQSGACQDERHKLFLFQAVFSALLIATVPTNRIGLLPPSYNYPYNLHESVPHHLKPASLNDLITIVYEQRSLDPNIVNDISIQEPLRSWLINAFHQKA